MDRLERREKLWALTTLMTWSRNPSAMWRSLRWQPSFWSRGSWSLWWVTAGKDTVLMGPMTPFMWEPRRRSCPKQSVLPVFQHQKIHFKADGILIQVNSIKLLLPGFKLQIPPCADVLVILVSDLETGVITYMEVVGLTFLHITFDWHIVWVYCKVFGRLSWVFIGFLSWRLRFAKHYKLTTFIDLYNFMLVLMTLT